MTVVSLLELSLVLLLLPLPFPLEMCEEGFADGAEMLVFDWLLDEEVKCPFSDELDEASVFIEDWVGLVAGF